MHQLKVKHVPKPVCQKAAVVSEREKERERERPQQEG